jgi:hypothetical protein
MREVGFAEVECDAWVGTFGSPARVFAAEGEIAHFSIASRRDRARHRIVRQWKSTFTASPLHALEQGQADRGQASTATEARMGDQNSPYGRGSNP